MVKECLTLKLLLHFNLHTMINSVFRCLVPAYREQDAHNYYSSHHTGTYNTIIAYMQSTLCWVRNSLGLICFSHFHQGLIFLGEDKDNFL